MRVLTIVHDEDSGPGVFSDVLSAAAAQVETWRPSLQTEPPVDLRRCDAVISFGGAAHPHHDELHPWISTEKLFLKQVLHERVPLLGVCLGAELIAEAEDAWSHKLAVPEIGWYEVSLTGTGADDPVLGPIGESFRALEWHSYEITLPARATELARGDNCVQAYRIGMHAWGVQFHPEVTGPDFQSWLDNFESDADAVAAQIDVQAIEQETAGRLADWHRVGRGICERFLLVAAAS